MERVRLNIEGIEKRETQDRVKSQLDGVIGIQEVFMSTDKPYLNVDYDEQTSEMEIRNHLQNNGYKINDME